MSGQAEPHTTVTPEASPALTRKALQEAVDSAAPEGVVVLAEGVYEIDVPLRVSGRITLRAEPGRAVVLSGGRQLVLDWTPHDAGVMRADLSEGIDLDAVAFDQLYLNGKRLHIARYPNYDPAARFFGGTAVDALSPERIGRWKDPAGGFIHSLHGSKWGGDHWRIKGKSAPDTLELEGGWMNNRPRGIHDTERFVENIFEELDAPGEWFVDRKARVLYVFPPEGEDLSSAELVVSGIERLIEVVGPSPEAPVGGLCLKGITLAHTARTFMKTNEPLLRSDWMIHRGGAVHIENAEGVVIEDCQLHKLGGNGVFVSGYAKDVAVRGCHVTDVGGSAACFVGKPAAVRSPSFTYRDFVELEEIDREPGPQTEDYPRDCVIEDCLLHDLGTVEKQVAGVQVSMAARITMRHLSIYDLPRAGINISEGTWGGHLIEGCDVFDTVLMTGDHGSFNAWGRDRFWHPNRRVMDEITSDHPELVLLDARETNIIRNSRWRCDHGWDIDLDDGSSNYEIYNNVCLNGGIKLREGFHRTVYNNIMINNSFHPHVWFSPSHDAFERNIVTRAYQPIRISDWGNRVDRNLFPDSPALEQAQSFGVDANSDFGDPVFLAPESGDFRVDETSPAIKLGFMNFPMDRFGVQKPELTAIARTPIIPELKAEEPTPSRDHLVRQFLGASVKKLVGLGEQSAAGIDCDRGLLILDLPADSIAAQQGLLDTDVLLKLNGVVINSVDDIQPAYLNSNDQRVELVVFRNQTDQVTEIEAGLAVRLTAERAEVMGVEEALPYDPEQDYLGKWSDPKAGLQWIFELHRQGRYDVFVELAADESMEGATWAVTVGGETLTGQTPDTGGSETFVRLRLGSIDIDPGEDIVARISPQKMPNAAVMNLRAVELIRV